MTDEDWMAMALAEAKKGLGKTAPNPPVGAVIVKEGKLLGAGWHRKAGLPHAEVEAMRAAAAVHGEAALKGASAYITLEPCSTLGKTPACTSGLIQAGVSRVIYACADPNPVHVGAADAILALAGIQVTSGVLAVDCEKILRPFHKVQRTGYPWVIWKAAMSLDGKITRPGTEGQWLSGVNSRYDVQRLRSQVDAILTSGETVRRDLPSLTIREAEFLEGREQPWRVVVSQRPDQRVLDAPLFTDKWKHRTLLRSGDDLAVILRELVQEQKVLSLMMEAGGTFAAAMFSAGLIDEIVCYKVPILCGNQTRPGLDTEDFTQSISLREVEYQQLGDDMRIRGLIDHKRHV